VNVGITDTDLQVRARELDVLGAAVVHPLEAGAFELSLDDGGRARGEDFRGMVAPAATTLPAAIKERRPTVAPLSTTEFVPTSAPSSIVQSSIVAQWPIVTSVPMIVRLFSETCRTALSCTLLRAPIRIGPLSPRITAPNQMLADSATSTSPMSTAVGATNAEG